MSDIFFAGQGNLLPMKLFIPDGNYKSEDKLTDVYLLTYNRLLSYDYQRNFVDRLIKEKSAMKLFLAGTDKYGEDMRREVLDLYLAGVYWESKETMNKVLPSNILFSYDVMKKQEPKNMDIYNSEFNSKIFIDSGAFSMWTRGVEVNVDEYIEWLNKRSDYLYLFGQVDCIPGTKDKPPTNEEVREAAQKTWENYLYMRERVKKPEALLYTFHVGEPIEFLEQALEWTDENGNHIPYIALGGMVGKTLEARRNFLTLCFETIKNSSNPNVKTHAFGMTTMELLEEFPITSADSTSWIMTAAMGSIMSDRGTYMISTTQLNDPKHFSHLPKDVQKQIEAEICKYGYTLDTLASDRNARCIHNARYMKDKVSKIQRVQIPKKQRLF